MENMERQKFDDAWQDALTGAEQSPSENVWNAIDSKLTVAEGGTMKRRVIFYQRLAAASILFAVVFGSLTAYYVTENSNQSSRNQLANGESVVNQSINGQSGNQLGDEKVVNDQGKEKEPRADHAENKDQLVAGKTDDPTTVDKIIENKQHTDNLLAEAQSGNNDEAATLNSIKNKTNQEVSKNKTYSGVTSQKQSMMIASDNEVGNSEAFYNECKNPQQKFCHSYYT